ncbi:MAG: hypothetical protein ACIAXF_17125 [Phycisphaerales bacterium JB063]
MFTNLYVALCGAALTAATYTLLGWPVRADAATALVFSATLVVYNLDRLVEPSPGDSPHEKWVAQHRGMLWGLTGLATAGCAASVVFLGTPARGSLLLPAVIALGYCVPVLPRRTPGGWRMTRLKEVPGAKLLLIGGVWTYATAGLPMLEAGVSFWTLPSAVLLLGRLLFILAVALPFDIPDIARDRASGIMTLPQSLGLAGTRRVALGLTAGFAACAALHPWPAAAGVLVSAAVTAALLLAMHEQRGVVYYEVALDGLLLAQSALLFAAAWPV